MYLSERIIRSLPSLRIANLQRRMVEAIESAEQGEHHATGAYICHSREERIIRNTSARLGRLAAITARR